MLHNVLNENIFILKPINVILRRTPFSEIVPNVCYEKDRCISDIEPQTEKKNRYSLALGRDFLGIHIADTHFVLNCPKLTNVDKSLKRITLFMQFSFNS